NPQCGFYNPQCGFEFSAHYFLFLYAQIICFQGTVYAYKVWYAFVGTGKCLASDHNDESYSLSSKIGSSFVSEN
ncbi:MAG: hypothetical protein J6C86_11590, partial [Bacteroidaceae bacterium]|nr:hypothetical protein [Bacteroidaceae bacterium]